MRRMTDSPSVGSMTTMRPVLGSASGSTQTSEPSGITLSMHPPLTRSRKPRGCLSATTGGTYA